LRWERGGNLRAITQLLGRAPSVSVPSDGPAPGVPAPAPTAEPEDLEPRSSRAGEFVGRFWAWLFLLVLVVIFSATGSGFLDLFNFQAIGANMAIMLIMALGHTFVIISGGIDLSTGFVMRLSSVGTALAISRLGPDAPLALGGARRSPSPERCTGTPC
jgi:hypothetical protein